MAEYEGILGRHREAFFPELIFVQPKAEIMKSRSLSGSAYIDFPVDQTVIYPDYRRNTTELGKIQATIDSVRNDKDVTITSVWLKGFASPESPYKHNTELAIGRTAALKKHIGQLYHFADSIIQTDYEPEDWAGLRRYVEQSNINYRAEILALIDSDMEPDAKEAKIKRTYPDEYRFMLQNFYPALRHTDYRIDYNIRKFNKVEEIKRIMAEQPQKLPGSMNPARMSLQMSLKLPCVCSRTMRLPTSMLPMPPSGEMILQRHAATLTRRAIPPRLSMHVERLPYGKRIMTRRAGTWVRRKRWGWKKRHSR